MLPLCQGATCGVQHETFYSIYLYTSWQTGIKSMLYDLLAVPFCSVPMAVQTDIIGLH